MSKSHRSASLGVNESMPTPERKLWRGVLEQAYADAEFSLGLEEDDELFSDHDRARRFLRADVASEAEELKLVCDYAEVPFDRVVMWARKRYAALTQQDFEKAEVRDAKEVEEIIKTIESRKAATLALSELPSSLLPLPPLSPLLQ
jgi:hypothetical protein